MNVHDGGDSLCERKYNLLSLVLTFLLLLKKKDTYNKWAN
jgi:hypothetical protein